MTTGKDSEATAGAVASSETTAFSDEYVAAARRWGEACNALAELKPSDSPETAKRLADEYLAASVEFDRAIHPDEVAS